MILVPESLSMTSVEVPSGRAEQSRRPSAGRPRARLFGRFLTACAIGAALIIGPAAVAGHARPASEPDLIDQATSVGLGSAPQSEPLDPTAVATPTVSALPTTAPTLPVQLSSTTPLVDVLPGTSTPPPPGSPPNGNQTSPTQPKSGTSPGSSAGGGAPSSSSGPGAPGTSGSAAANDSSPLQLRTVANGGTLASAFSTLAANAAALAGPLTLPLALAVLALAAIAGIAARRPERFTKVTDEEGSWGN